MAQRKLRDEPPPPPLEPQQAKDRSVFIRENIKIVEKLRDEGKSFDEMKEAASDFANNFPHLFIMVSSKDGYDSNTLELMLSMIDKMGSSKISQHDASVKVGEVLMKNHMSKLNPK
jgi:hypothetical protein